MAETITGSGAPPTGPRIDAVFALRGAAGANATSAIAGDVLKIVGSGFGASAKDAAVLFGDTPAAPLSIGFSGEAMAVTCPLLAAPTDVLSVRVATEVSNPVPLRLDRPATSDRPLGEATQELFAAVDEYAVLVALLARAVARHTRFRAELENAAEALDGGRRVAQRSVELFMQWKPLQANLRFEPVRVIERFDEMIVTGALTERMAALTQSTFGEGGVLAQAGGFPAGLGAALLGDGPSLPDTGTRIADVSDAVGFQLHEGHKFLNAVEDTLKSLSASIALGLDGGVVGLADVSINIGFLVSALADLIDMISQLVSGGKRDPLERLEEKLDQQGTQLKGISDKADRAEQKLDRLWSMVDTAEHMLASVEANQDRAEKKLDLAELKLDKIDLTVGDVEAKQDRAETKLDAIETNQGKAEKKLDTIEQNQSKAEKKLENIEQNQSKAEKKLENVEQNQSKAEKKLENVEQNQDKAETKLDDIEQNQDKAEIKLENIEQNQDRAEIKLDTIGGDLDKVEGKLDKAEGKLDKIEQKLDKTEQKLDRTGQKPDSISPLLPLGGSVANQRLQGTRLSAAAVAVSRTDGQVYLRGAVDIDPQGLIDPRQWSAWIPLGRPTGAQPLVEVSIGLQYQERSDQILNGLLTVRDGGGVVHHRTLDGLDQSALLDPARWTGWLDFLEQPQ